MYPVYTFGSRPPYQGVKPMSEIDDEFYSELVKSFTDWQRNELEVAELQVREQCRMVLEREARLLDQGRYKEWLELFAERCVVLVPRSAQASDPPREATVVFYERPPVPDPLLRPWHQHDAAARA